MATRVGFLTASNKHQLSLSHQGDRVNFAGRIRNLRMEYRFSSCTQQQQPAVILLALSQQRKLLLVDIFVAQQCSNN
jgi:hypothetical protein